MGKVYNIVPLFNKSSGEEVSNLLRFCGYEVIYPANLTGLITSDEGYFDRGGSEVQTAKRKETILSIIQEIIGCEYVYTGCYVDEAGVFNTTVKYRSNMPLEVYDELGIIHSFIVNILKVPLVTPEQLKRLVDLKAMELGSEKELEEGEDQNE